MAEIDYSPLEDAVITLEDENGNEIQVTMQCVFEYNGQDYAALINEDNLEDGVYFFQVDADEKKDKIDFEFSNIEDDELLDELLQIFQQIMESDDDEPGIEYEEDEDDEDADEDEDDSKWDEFITKKLD